MPASLAKTRSLALPFLYYPTRLKADEDIHLLLQGLDYWSRVKWHHIRGEFPRFGYFAERELSTEKPLLYLVAPALHVHPTTDILPRYISPEIEWEFVGIDERWREGVKVVFRKRPERSRHTETRMYRELQSPHCASRFERSRTSCPRDAQRISATSRLSKLVLRGGGN
jgi:hypothetical protein